LQGALSIATHGRRKRSSNFAQASRSE
jgi:hypothetical protein